VAYLGDVSGDGNLSAGDAAMIARVAVGLDADPASETLGGFAAYPLADPDLLGELSGNGIVDSSDITLLNATVAGIVSQKVPVVPAGLTIVPTGPDPLLSLPTHPQVSPGDIVTIPVNIDTARPEGSGGLVEAVLALRYDPQIFTLTAADFKLGTVPLAGSGWQLGAAIDPDTGEIGINLFSITPIQSRAGGSLVLITLQALASAPAGQGGLRLVPEVNPTGLRIYRTALADSQGALVVHVAMDDGPGTTARGDMNLGHGVDSQFPVPPALMDQVFVKDFGNGPPAVPIRSLPTPTTGEAMAALLPPTVALDTMGVLAPDPVIVLAPADEHWRWEETDFGLLR
jgi:hypothetical protein